MKTWHRVARALIVVCGVFATSSAVCQGPASAAAGLQQARARVATATLPGGSWSGPTTGPAAVPGKYIALMAEDLRNGGVVGVAQGVREAAAVMGWTLKIFDGGGSPAGRAKALALALASRPDGLVLCGSDALESRAALAPFAQRKLAVVGWHAGPKPGPIDGTPVAMNVSTDPLQVARVTALAAVAQSDGRAGVVILTDSRFGIAMAKANAMADVIRACPGCTLLEVRDVAISDSAEKMAPLTEQWLAQYGKRWTHALAINDLYFDYALPALTRAGAAAKSLSLLSAGDGSAAAFMRIQAHIFQTGTVAEPLNAQGWQVVDELNRLFAGKPVSAFVAPAHLVTAENVGFDGGARFQYDPDNGYRDVYRRIWKR
ncbi:ribose transport system substrate-binding protein [Janthinobacterium sp. CG_23.3]|uniref:substrate-binding domain-containing protein n=1 Tax=unclassified Janthinobacterium TaxID=2610881 RepID=UPI0009DB2D53|nr:MULTISPECIES: substrate-binding domain-containing protein [unclassified Janthinobacterium]MEC5163341.1 ribose transport system substrate-binding protein [Janthinobacterium sp. CG_S6]